MSEDQKRLYDQRRAYYHESLKREIAINGIQKSQFLFFQALTELRQIASVPESKSNNTIASPKVEMLIEYVADAVANDHKVIIFTNFIASIELIGEQLDKEGIDFVSMTGSTKDRQTRVDRFQNDSRCKVFLMTLKTGGVGLNLTAADTVFIFEPCVEPRRGNAGYEPRPPHRTNQESNELQNNNQSKHRRKNLASSAKEI